MRGNPLPSKYVGDVRSGEQYRSTGHDGEDGEQPEAEPVDHHRRELPVAARPLSGGVLSHPSGEVPDLAKAGEVPDLAKASEVPDLAENVAQQGALQLGRVVGRRR